MTSSRREDERVHKNAIFNRLSTGVSSAFKDDTTKSSREMMDE